MCLIDRLTAWDDDSIRCSTGTHLDPANPLRRDGHLSAVHVIEYAGQATALHGALVQCAPGKGEGFRTLLAAVSSLHLEVRFLDLLEGLLDISAVRELSSRGSSMYRFSVAAQGERVAHGRFAVMSMRRVEA
jgi:predicted hotdog family 3-hydroxylacyl-ACP dehydratase